LLQADAAQAFDGVPDEAVEFLLDLFAQAKIDGAGWTLPVKPDPVVSTRPLSNRVLFRELQN